MSSFRCFPRWFIAVVLLLLAATGFLHLSADFPNHSRWVDDVAKYTDEGWYASGGINHVLTGHWLRPGDFNPMVAIPFWSILMGILFHFTGIDIAVARGIAFLFTIGTMIAAGALMERNHRGLGPILMLLIVSSPLLYFFSRFAILEPPLIFFLTTAALVAYHERLPGTGRSVLCGVLFTLAVFTKSSALFVAPAILYLLWFPHRSLWLSPSDRRARAIRAVTVPILAFALCYGLYWVLVIHSHRAEFNVLYRENMPVLDRRSIEKSIRILYRSFTWLDPILFPVAAVAALLAVSKLPALRKDPLFGFAVLFFLGYAAFMVLHLDAEPHYFAVLVVPVMILVLLLVEALNEAMPRTSNAIGALVWLAVIVDVATIARLLGRPSYTFRDACLQIRSQINSDPSATPLVIGHGAIESTYFTHIPALDDLGSMSMDEKIHLYHPGWVVVWSDDVSVVGHPTIAGKYALTEMGRYYVFDNPRRQYLFLYRISPLASSIQPGG